MSSQFKIHHLLKLSHLSTTWSLDLILAVNIGVHKSFQSMQKAHPAHPIEGKLVLVHQEVVPLEVLLKG